MIAALLLSLTLGQGSPSMAGPAVRSGTASVAADYFASLLTSVTGECSGASLSWSDGTAISLSRVSTAYCTNSTGTMTLVTSGQPRVEGTGVLIEGARTNNIIYSQALDDASWSIGDATVTANAAAAPDGTTTAERVTMLNVVGSSPSIWSATYAESASIYAKSVYAKAGTVNYISLSSFLDNTQYTVVNLSNGTVSASQNADTTVEALANGWYRIHFIHLSPGGLGSLELRIADTAANATPGTSWSRGGTESVYVWGAQSELGTFISSYIPTTGTSVTRPAENYSFTPGTSIDTAGCFLGTLVHGRVFPGVIRWLTTSGGSPMTSSASTTLLMHDNLNTATRTVTAVTGREVIARSAWGGSGLSIKESGGTAGTATFDGTMGSSTAYLGTSGGGSAYAWGHMRDLRLGNTQTGCQP